jgi:hypothetical protein
MCSTKPITRKNINLLKTIARLVPMKIILDRTSINDFSSELDCNIVYLSGPFSEIVSAFPSKQLVIYFTCGMFSVFYWSSRTKISSSSFSPRTLFIYDENREELMTRKSLFAKLPESGNYPYVSYGRMYAWKFDQELKREKEWKLVEKTNRKLVIQKGDRKIEMKRILCY